MVGNWFLPNLEKQLNPALKKLLNTWLLMPYTINSRSDNPEYPYDFVNLKLKLKSPLSLSFKQLFINNQTQFRISRFQLVFLISKWVSCLWSVLKLLVEPFTGIVPIVLDFNTILLSKISKPPVTSVTVFNIKKNCSWSVKCWLTAASPSVFKSIWWTITVNVFIPKREN